MYRDYNQQRALHRVFVLCSLAVCSANCLAGAAAQKNAALDLPVRLADDRRLDRSISLDAAGISLDELLEKVSDSTVRLACGRTCAEQKLQVRLKERSLCALMEALAELLSGEWKHVEDGYRLDMGEQAASRRDRWWRLFKGERDRALAAQRACVLQAMRGIPPAQSRGPALEKFDPAVQARAAAENAIFRILPSALQERIASQLNDIVYYRIFVGVGTEDEEGVTAIRFTDLPASVQDDIRQKTEAIGAPYKGLSWDRAIVTFFNGGIAVMLSVVFPDGKTAGTLSMLTLDTATGARPLPLSHVRLAEHVRQLGPAAPETWKQLAAFQESRVWPNALPAGVFRTGLPPRRADVLHWLGEKADIEFVADYYSRPCSPNPVDKGRPLNRPIQEELNYRAAEQDMSWKQRADKLYLFRDNRWYRDDYLEIPNRLLKRWMERWKPPDQSDAAADGKKPLTLAEAIKRQLDWEAEVLTSLTPWQTGNGLKWFHRDDLPEKPLADKSKRIWNYVEMPFFFSSDRIFRQYHTVRFYASLSEAERDALVHFRLALRSLTPEQQQLATFASAPVAIWSQVDISETSFLGLNARIPLPDPGSKGYSPIFAAPVRLWLKTPETR